MTPTSKRSRKPNQKCADISPCDPKKAATKTSKNPVGAGFGARKPATKQAPTKPAEKTFKNPVGAPKPATKQAPTKPAQKTSKNAVGAPKPATKQAPTKRKSADPVTAEYPNKRTPRNPKWTIPVAIEQIQLIADISDNDKEHFSNQSFNSFFHHFVVFASFVVTYKRHPTTRVSVMEDRDVDVHLLQETVNNIFDHVQFPAKPFTKEYQQRKVNKDWKFWKHDKHGHWVMNTRRKRVTNTFIHPIAVDALDAMGFKWTDDDDTYRQVPEGDAHEEIDSEEI